MSISCPADRVHLSRPTLSGAARVRGPWAGPRGVRITDGRDRSGRCRGLAEHRGQHGQPLSGVGYRSPRPLGARRPSWRWLMTTNPLGDITMGRPPRARWTRESGSELIEMAFTLPMLLLVAVGIIDFGFLFQRYEIVTNGAREGRPDRRTRQRLRSRCPGPGADVRAGSRSGDLARKSYRNALANDAVSWSEHLAGDVGDRELHQPVRLSGSYRHLGRRIIRNREPSGPSDDTER